VENLIAFDECISADHGKMHFGGNEVNGVTHSQLRFRLSRLLDLLSADNVEQTFFPTLYVQWGGFNCFMKVGTFWKEVQFAA